MKKNPLQTNICPVCNKKALVYQETTISQKFYDISDHGEILKTPIRKSKDNSWSQLESGVYCSECGFTLLPTQTTDYFKHKAGLEN